MNQPFDAVLLASFGGPESPEEVLPFLERVTAGRGIPRERLQQVAHHYHALGGVSPINSQNRSLIEALRRELDRRGRRIPIHFGNRNSAPFFDEALTGLYSAGHRTVLALVTSAYSSYSGCRQYRENLAAALDHAGLVGQLQVAKIVPYFDRAGFAEANAAALLEALASLQGTGVAPGAQHVLFTTHSVPLAMARTSGPPQHRGKDGPGVYTEQHLDVARRVVAIVTAAGVDVGSWELVYQSRSGPPQVPWLEPDVNDAIRSAAAAGTRAVVVAPIGFISDHVEVLWDLDNEARQTALELGLRYVRVPTAGLAEPFVSGLADLIEANLADGRPSPSPLCAEDCCPNPAGRLPAVPGAGDLL